MSSKKAAKNTISTIRKEIERITPLKNEVSSEPLSNDQLACWNMIANSKLTEQEKISQFHYLYLRQVRMTRDVSTSQDKDGKYMSNLKELNEQLLKKVGHMQELINKYDEVCKELKNELKNQQEQFEKKLGEQAQEKANIITGFQKESDMIMQKLEEYNNVNKSVSRDNEKLRNDMKKRDEIFKEKDKLFNEYKETVDKRINEMNQTLTEYYSENIALKQQLESAKKLCEDYSQMVSTQGKAIEQYKQHHEKLTGIIKTMEGALEVRNKALKEKNTMISQLNSLNKEKKEEIKELHKKMNVLEKMCKGLQDKLRSKQVVEEVKEEVKEEEVKEEVKEEGEKQEEVQEEAEEVEEEAEKKNAFFTVSPPTNDAIIMNIPFGENDTDSDDENGMNALLSQSLPPNLNGTTYEISEDIPSVDTFEVDSDLSAH